MESLPSYVTRNQSSSLNHEIKENHEIILNPLEATLLDSNYNIHSNEIQNKDVITSESPNQQRIEQGEIINTPKISKEDRSAWRRLVAAAVLSLVFFVIELIGGIKSQSLAIFGDALHMLVDLLGLLLALFACYISRRKATKLHSFGFHRVELICAFISIFTIWVITGVLVSKAIERITVPKEIDKDIMLAIAVVGLAVNIFTIFILGHKGHSHSGNDNHNHGAHDNVNVRAAMLHIIGDVVSSIGVLISSIIIKFQPTWHILDPICTFFFAVIVLATTLKLLRDTITILMEATPSHIDTLEVERDLLNIEFVESLHDLHVWTLTAGKIALAVHIEIKENSEGSCYEHVLAQAQSILCSKYQVHHTTIQVETRRLELAAHCLSSICNGGICSGGNLSPAESTDPLLGDSHFIKIQHDDEDKILKMH